MRNLKRALSLTLASVMLLGMMVVGSSAAGYPDVSEEENIEAIEVLQSVGVMEGDNNGNFNPDDYVTREQMAVIMSKLLNLDYNYYQGTNPFSDVPAWAAPYVAACAANGITSGIGGGMYGAGQNVNAVQAALMMLKALGYFQYQADFGEDYVLATVKQATEIGLFTRIDSNAQAALTRNEVAQMALNALKSDMVRFTGDVGIEIPNVGNVGYKSEYTPRTSTDPKFNRLIDNKHSSNIDTSGQYYIQLGEELYDGNLVQRYDSDIFERPSYTWTYKTELIGTYVDKAKLLATYTSGVKARELYDLLNNITLRDYDLEIYVDGHKAGDGDDSEYNQSGGSYDCSVVEVANFDNLVRSNTGTLGVTGDGVLTEVYLDRDNEIVTVASMHTWLAQATSSYNATRETAAMKVFMTSANGTSKTVNVENVPEVEGVAADAFYLVRMSDKDTAKLEVVDIAEPEAMLESTVTKFTTSNENSRRYPSKLTTGGNEYKKSNRAIYDADTLDLYDADLLARSTYNVYLDKYGYFIGVDLFEGEKQYVFVTGYDMKNSNLTIKTAEAAGIFLDGTMDTITVNVKDTNDNIESMVTNKSNAESKEYYKAWGAYLSDGVYLLNRWYTYTENNGVYTLKPCVDNNGAPMMLAAKTGNDPADQLKMNCSKLTLNSVDNTSGERLLEGETMMYSTGNLTDRRAYGEDESVFITVDVDDVSAKLNDDLNVTKAITDVNGVYTGVQNIDLITERNDRVVGGYYTAVDTPATSADTADWWAELDSDGTPTNNSYVGENAYAVYDKNHFIIGAVILGEAEGAANTKAYILDPVKYERYENGTYYWQFEAVIDGEIVTQEAQSKYASTIKTMRENQYEIVNLRYTDDIVTGVVELDRLDRDGADKIYGNQFNEIKSRQLDEDKESVYDVTLTGVNNGADSSGVVYDKNGATAGVEFAFVTRARDYTEHAAAGKLFTETEMGYLNLQGRSLWVLNGQTDHGIDFTTDAKAVVIQPENNKLETRAYSSVQEAVDSLSDAIDPNTEVKEFRGIITAALNSQGVAEWVVFFSDTNLDTRNNNNPQAATINVNIHVKLPGAAATKWSTVKVKRPATGNMATVSAPAIAGYTPIEPSISFPWSRDNDGIVITFEYTRAGVTPPASGETQGVRVEYVTSYTNNAGTVTVTSLTPKATEPVVVELDAAGYGYLTEDLLTKVPTGYTVKKLGAGNVTGTNTDLGCEIEKSSSAITKYVLVEPKPVKSVEILGSARAALSLDVVFDADATAVGTAAEEAGLKVKVTYTDDTTQTLDADDSTLTWKLASGKITVTYKAQGAQGTGTESTGTEVVADLYAAIATSVTGKTGELDEWTITAESGKTTNDTAIELTFLQTTADDFTADEAATLIAKLADNSTGHGIKLTAFVLKGTVTPGVAAGGSGSGTQATFKVTVTVAPEGNVDAASVTLLIAAPAAP